MYRLLAVFFFLFWIKSAIAQDVDTVVMTGEAFEEVASSSYEYWKKDYYKDIPRVDYLSSSSSQTFTDVIERYQSKEFEYIESISDKISIWKSIKDWIGNFFSDLFPKVDSSPANWVYDLLGILGALLVVFILYKLFFSGKQFIVDPKESQDDEESVVDFVEKNLLDVDINNYLKNAIQDNNYPLAIRYQQLLNIQLLAKKDVISWNQTKTNLELTDEIQNENLRSDFKQCSSLFDHVWFGEFEISKSQFDQISMQFQEFQRRWS